MTDIVLAADLGGTNLRMAAVDSDGAVIYRSKERTPRSHDGTAIVDAMREMAEDCLQNRPADTVKAVAAAVPAIIDFDNGTVIKAPNLPELDGLPLVEQLEKALGIPAILENDANAAAIGECWLGSAIGTRNSITVTLGTGVGGGIFIDGKIVRGQDGTAGEIGHITVVPEGHACGCGSLGCVEQYASAGAIVRMARELAEEDSLSALNSLDEFTSEKVYDTAKAGDASALEVFRLQGYYLGIMLAGLVNTLNPEVIVIGGGVSASWDLFVEHARKEVLRRSYELPAERANIVRASLGDDAGIMGSARLGFDHSAGSRKA